MKKTLHIFFLILLLGVTIQSGAWAKSAIELESDRIAYSKTDRYIKFVYDKLKFNKMNKLSFDAFKPAFYGFLNLVEAGKIAQSATLSICDFTLSSNLKRLWVIDVKNKKVLFNTLVAHGMGTGEEYAVNFSNTQDSHQSSLGFYLTGETYQGGNGFSLKLHGVDGNFNNNAFDRGIVIHAAEYVSEQFARDNKRIGRSHGCPALPVDIAPKVIDRIENGHCLYIHHSTRNYFKASYWLNNKIMNLPQEADLMELNMPIKSNPRYVAEVKDIENTSQNADFLTAEKDNVDTKKVEEKAIEPILRKLNKSDEVEDLKMDDKFTTTTVIIKKPATKTEIIEPPVKKKSIMIINVDSRTGVSDTSYVK